MAIRFSSGGKGIEGANLELPSRLIAPCSQMRGILPPYVICLTYRGTGLCGSVKFLRFIAEILWNLVTHPPELRIQYLRGNGMVIRSAVLAALVLWTGAGRAQTVTATVGANTNPQIGGGEPCD